METKESKMVKDFDLWNEIKKRTDTQDRKFYVKEREIVWLSLGENIGDEENGKGKEFGRPVLVLKIFNKNIFFGVPLSSVLKPNNKYYLKIKVTERKLIESKLGVEKNFEIYERSLLLSHCRLFDTKRVFKHIGYADKQDFQKTKATLRDLLF